MFDIQRNVEKTRWRPSLKKLIVSLVILGILISSISAQTTIESAARKDPRSMGSGGTSLLFSTGYDAFFGNPAGFVGQGSLTLGDASFWGYFPVTPAGLNALDPLLSGLSTSSEAEATLVDFLAENGDLGFGGTIGLGWAGKGLGIGFNFLSEARLSGTGISDARVIVRNQATAIFGYAFPINLGIFKFSFGADARGFYRLDSAVNGWNDGFDLVMAGLGYSTSTFDNLVASEMMSGGIGYAVDAGATCTIGPLSVGFMVRDLVSQIQMGDSSVNDILANSDFPVDGTNLVTIEPVVTAGLGLKRNPKGLVAPSLYVETDDVQGLAETLMAGQMSSDAILASLRVGGDLRLLQIFILRAGLNANRFSVGAGVDIYILRADVAMFQELSSTGATRSGLSARFALKL